MVFDNIGKICPICQKEDLNYEINDGNVTSNITAYITMQRSIS